MLIVLIICIVLWSGLHKRRAATNSTSHIALPRFSSCISYYNGGKHQHSYIFHRENHQVAFFSDGYCPTRPSLRVEMPNSKYRQLRGFLQQYNTNEKNRTCRAQHKPFWVPFSTLFSPRYHSLFL